MAGPTHPAQPHKILSETETGTIKTLIPTTHALLLAIPPNTTQQDQFPGSETSCAGNHFQWSHSATQGTKINSPLSFQTLKRLLKLRSEGINSPATPVLLVRFEQVRGKTQRLLLPQQTGTQQSHFHSHLCIQTRFGVAAQLLSVSTPTLEKTDM